MVTARPDPILSARLTEAGRVHCCGSEARLMGAGMLPPPPAVSLQHRGSRSYHRRLDPVGPPCPAANDTPSATSARVEPDGVGIGDVGEGWRALLVGAPPILR